MIHWDIGLVGTGRQALLYQRILLQGLGMAIRRYPLELKVRMPLNPAAQFLGLSNIDVQRQVWL